MRRKATKTRKPKWEEKQKKLENRNDKKSSKNLETEMWRKTTKTRKPKWEEKQQKLENRNVKKNNKN